MAYQDMTYDRKTAKVARYYDRTKNGAFGVPISLQVALCDQCFNRCIMCDHPSRPVMHQMPVERWLERLGHFARLGVESVCYSGGDPMAYPFFNDVMQNHAELGVEFGMTITGYVPPTIDVRLMSYAKWVRVSLDAVTPEVYAKVRGKTPVRKVLDSIDRMLAAGVKVGLGITVHADNIDDQPAVNAWAAERGITDIERHHIVPVGSADRATQAVTWHRKIEPFTKCHAVKYQLYIDAAGDVYPCCITAGDAQAAPQAYALGNLWKDPWESVWAATQAYSELPYNQLPPICRTCCIQRLSQINATVDAIESSVVGKQFF